MRRALTAVTRARFQALPPPRIPCVNTGKIKPTGSLSQPRRGSESDSTYVQLLPRKTPHYVPPNINREHPMSVQLEIIRAPEFIRFGPKGEFDLVGTCGAMHSLAEACKKRGLNRALVDNRNARAELSPNELAAIVNAFCDIGFTRDLRLAILHSAERYQRARLFAFISRIKGWNVRAFGDFEQAMCWLSADQIQPPHKTASSHRRQVNVSHASHDEKSIAIKRATVPQLEHHHASERLVKG